MIELGYLFGFRCPDGNMIDLAWLLPPVISITLLNFWVFFPRDVEPRSSRVVTPEYGKRHLLQPFGDERLRILLLHCFQNVADIVYLEAEVVQRRGKSRTTVQHGEPYDAVANVALVGIVKAPRYSLHTEYLLVKGRHAILVLSIESEMSDFSRHDFPLL
jgi:hypothetical protein